MSNQPESLNRQDVAHVIRIARELVPAFREQGADPAATPQKLRVMLKTACDQLELMTELADWLQTQRKLAEGKGAN